MKKVCIVSAYSYYFFSNGKTGRVGGAELDLFLVGKYLSRDENFKVSFVVADFGQNNIESYEEIKIFKSVKLRRSLMQFILAPFKLFGALKNADSDMYICSPAGPETGLTALFCWIYKRKFVYRTAHDIDCNRTYVKNNGLFGKIYEMGLLRADKIFTSVKIHEEILKSTYGDKIKNILFLPYGLEPNKDISNEDKAYILWVARGEKWKNPQFFLDLAESFPGEKFIMIMPKKAEEIDFFNKIRERALKILNLEFIDGVPFDKIQPYFDKAKVFVNTSESEGFTFTILQSGMANTPVLYYKVDPDGIIQKKQLGYWVNGDKNKFKDCLSKLVSNNDDWKEKSDNISRYIKDRHSIEKNIQVWKDALNDI